MPKKNRSEYWQAGYDWFEENKDNPELRDEMPDNVVLSYSSSQIQAWWEGRDSAEEDYLEKNPSNKEA